MTDGDFVAAAKRRYLAAHPDHGHVFEELPPAEWPDFLATWLGTIEAHRLMLSDQAERMAGDEFLSDDAAEALRELARDLRDTPIVGRPPFLA